MNEGRFEGVGGLKIFTRSWRPEGKPRAVVVISHGFNSHSGHYQWPAEQFVTRGLAVHALDHRGRGKSDGERFFVAKFSDYVDDLATLIKMVKMQEPGVPIFLLGHSAGGVIACAYTLEYQDQLAGLICESFAHEVPAPDFALAVIKGLSHVAPHAHVLKLRNEDFSRDLKWVAMMNADPLIAHEVQPTSTVAAMVRADERLKKDFPIIRLPVLILHGTLDRATKPSGSRRFYEMAGSTDKTLKIYEGHFHDLLADIDKEVVMSDILRWIDARLPA
jgi:acylglycerol lipase